MGLASTIENAVASTFTAIDDLASTITYRREDVTSHNLATGGQTVTDTDTSLKAVFSRFDNAEIDDTHVQRNDERAIIQAAALTITPKPGDRIIKADASEWDVVDVQGVPGESIWKLQIRKAAA